MFIFSYVGRTFHSSIIRFSIFSSLVGLPLLFIVAIIETSNNKKSKDKIINILLAMISLGLLTGSVFKLQHWPMYGYFLVSGKLLSLIIIPVAIYHNFKGEINKKGKVPRLLYLLSYLLYF